MASISELYIHNAAEIKLIKTRYDGLEWFALYADDVKVANIFGTANATAPNIRVVYKEETSSTLSLYQPQGETHHA